MDEHPKNQVSNLALLTNSIISKVDTYFEHRYVPKVVFSAVEAAL